MTTWCIVPLIETTQRKRKMLHAWKSDKLAAYIIEANKDNFVFQHIPHTFVYLNYNGDEVFCNFVSHSDVDSGTKWDDVEYIGPVTEWVRSIY